MNASWFQLLSGERLVREEGVSPANLVFASAVELTALAVGELILIAVFGLLQPLAAMAGPTSASSSAQLALLAEIALPLVMLAAYGRQLLLALSTRYALTDQRLLTARGLVAHHMVQAELDRIQDVRVHQDVMGRILNYGDVLVATAGASGLIAVKCVRDPEGWAHALYEHRHPFPVACSADVVWDTRVGGVLPPA